MNELPDGVVSALITFTEVLPQQSSGMHCGMPMELVTPALGGAAVLYTFEPVGQGAVELPPVWRCRCGFQLDAWQPSAQAAGHTSAASAPARATAPYAA